MSTKTVKTPAKDSATTNKSPKPATPTKTAVKKPAPKPAVKAPAKKTVSKPAPSEIQKKIVDNLRDTTAKLYENSEALAKEDSDKPLPAVKDPDEIVRLLAAANQDKLPQAPKLKATPVAVLEQIELDVLTATPPKQEPICVPPWEDIPEENTKALKTAINEERVTQPEPAKISDILERLAEPPPVRRPEKVSITSVLNSQRDAVAPRNNDPLRKFF